MVLGLNSSAIVLHAVSTLYAKTFRIILMVFEGVFPMIFAVFTKFFFACAFSKFQLYWV